jgi:hypothetical protein
VRALWSHFRRATITYGKLVTDSIPARRILWLFEMMDTCCDFTNMLLVLVPCPVPYPDIAQKSTQLSMESKKYAAQAKHANRMRIIKQYAPVAVVIGVVILLYLGMRSVRS